MGRLISKSKHEIGLSPDELIFRGNKKDEEVTLRLIDFDPNNLEEESISTVQDVLSYRNKETVTWFNVDGLHNKSLMQEIAVGFGFEQIILADVMNTEARPKVVEHDNCLFISLKMLREDPETGNVLIENLCLIITESVLITFQEQKGDVFEPVRDRIRKQKKRIRNSGTDYLAIALLDVVIDNYIYIIGILGEKIERLEENLLQEPNQSVIEQINTYKRELNFLRKSIRPAKEMIASLAKLETDFISEKCAIHIDELQHNISQANESTDGYRDILSDQLNIYHTTISSKLNDIMKFLTIFSVIFIPLTFIAGIYGTNFEVVPELKYEYSYFIMWAVMVVVAIGMLLYFRKRKWF